MNVTKWAARARVEAELAGRVRALAAELDRELPPPGGAGGDRLAMRGVPLVGAARGAIAGTTPEDVVGQLYNAGRARRRRGPR